MPFWDRVKGSSEEELEYKERSAQRSQEVRQLVQHLGSFNPHAVSGYSDVELVKGNRSFSRLTDVCDEQNVDTAKTYGTSVGIPDAIFFEPEVDQTLPVGQDVAQQIDRRLEENRQKLEETTEEMVPLLLGLREVEDRGAWMTALSLEDALGFEDFCTKYVALYERLNKTMLGKGDSWAELNAQLQVVRDVMPMMNELWGMAHGHITTERARTILFSQALIKDFQEDPSDFQEDPSRDRNLSALDFLHGHCQKAIDTDRYHKEMVQTIVERNPNSLETLEMYNQFFEIADSARKIMPVVGAQMQVKRSQGASRD